jgi:PHD/YefM family antitoxin component YafN of YafNO toxin-antitoxin module
MLLNLLDFFEKCYNYVQKEVFLLPKILPITDLRDTNMISEICHSKKEPIFITKNGYGDLVVMSIETYENLIKEVELDLSVAEAEAEYDKNGIIYDAKEALSSMRRKHFG